MKHLKITLMLNAELLITLWINSHVHTVHMYAYMYIYASILYSKNMYVL